MYTVYIGLTITYQYGNISDPLGQRHKVRCGTNEESNRVRTWWEKETQQARECYVQEITPGCWFFSIIIWKINGRIDGRFDDR